MEPREYKKCKAEMTQMILGYVWDKEDLKDEWLVKMLMEIAQKFTIRFEERD